MYNVFLHDKKTRETIKTKSFDRLIKATEPNKDLLLSRYKDRINSNLIRMTKDINLLPKTQRSGTSCESKRSWPKSSKFLSQNERVEKTSQFNQWRDTTPNNKATFKLRPREKSKEIQPSLKFSDKTGLERLEHSILTQKQFFDSSDPPDSSQKYLYNNYFGLAKPKFSGGKQVLDYYHFKTYFKTIESLALDIHSSVRNMSRAEENTARLHEKLGIYENKAKKLPVKQGELCKEEVIPISCEIMQKYGLWKDRKEKSQGRMRTTNWEG